MKKLSYIVLFLFCLVTLQAQSKEELERKKEKTLREINEARELLDRTVAQKSVSLRKVNLLNKGIRSRQALIGNIEEEIRWLQNEIIATEDTINRLTVRLKDEKKEYVLIIYSAYKSHTEYERLMYLLASENIGQAYQRLKYLKFLSDYRKAKIEEIKDISDRLERKQENLRDQQSEKLDLLEEKENESRKLINEKSQRTNLLRELSKEEERLRNSLAEKERIRQELEESIREIIEEEARKAEAGSVYTMLTPEQKLTGKNFTDNRGLLPWPVERGVVTGEFGEIDHPVLRGVKIMNNGIDISSTPEAKARAIFDGEVTRVFAILGANYTILIRHGEYLSVYQNVVNVRVKQGDKVLAKQVIGDVYGENDDNGTVLHLEIWKEKKILNPEDWLSK